MLLDDHYRQFMADKIDYIAPATVANYNLYYWRYISPVWGQTEMADIRRRDVLAQMQAWLKEGAPACYIRCYLSAIWSDELRNPAKGLRIPRNLPRYRPLTHDEMQRAIRDGVGHKYYPVFLTLAMTGMRPAELRGLQWGDVDLVGRTLYIQRIYNRRCILATKTAMSTRDIVMPQRLVDCLRRYKRKTSNRKWVFTTRLGEPVSASSTIRYWLGQFFDSLGIRYVTPYSFRHYFAASMMDANVPLTTVQRYGGWCDGKMVLLYAARQGRRGMEAACALLDSDEF